MTDWYSALAAAGALPAAAATELDEQGFVVLPGPIPPERFPGLVDLYDHAMATASAEDLRVGSTSTKLSDFVNRDPAFHDVYVFPPLLEACCHVIGKPFRLSSFAARTIRPGARAQELHVDVPRGSADWPLLGFILMVDDFRPDNGTTRFVPGSHRWSATPAESLTDVYADHEGQRLACGSAGSLLVFNGSAWHGHTANRSDGPRRSLQGAFIPRAGRAATDFAARMKPETRARLGALAHHLLGL